MPRLMLYTCRVKCWDGAVRTFERAGYFEDLSVLRHRLVDWNGCMGPAGEPYAYFETRSQALHNDGACCVREELIPKGQIVYTGPCQHHYYRTD